MSTSTTADRITLEVQGLTEPVQIDAGENCFSILKQHKGLVHKPVAARLNGRVIDLKAPIEENGTLQFLTFDDPQGREVFYHSTTHLMAQAVTELFPEVKLAIGPPIEDGFYYDFEVERPFTPEDLEKIEQRMKERCNDRLPVERSVMSRDEALEFYKRRSQDYKVELIEDFDDNSFSFYKQGDFIDMCRGPHVPDTGYLKHFKLLNVAGAYWRGDEHRPMLQRIYGTSAPSKEKLDDYLQRLEEAKERDHRKLGKELDLFSIQEEAGQGLVFWHPKGARVRTIIEQFWKDEHYKWGYEQVMIPHVFRQDLFEQSGHIENYGENMFAPMDVEGMNYYIKPMNCPGHILIYKSRLHSYRDLPVRYAELGTVYRYERSGALHGLLRVRGFTQDDAHIFCTPDQLEDEMSGVMDLADFMMTAFGFDYEVCLATRPEKSIGSDEVWEHAESTLRRVLEKRGQTFDVEEQGGAFYGPKIDINLVDALGRLWQGPTFQLDFNLPARFNVEYVNRDGEKKQVVMIHRTVLGSMERFMGNLIEHYKGAFPAWLAPSQVRVMTIVDEVLPYAQEVEEKLRRQGVRVELDSRNEKIGFKIREAESEKVPIMLVVGKREAQEGNVAVREHGRKDLGVMSQEQAFAHIREAIAIPKSNG